MEPSFLGDLCVQIAFGCNNTDPTSKTHGCRDLVRFWENQPPMPGAALEAAIARAA